MLYKQLDLCSQPINNRWSQENPGSNLTNLHCSNKEQYKHLHS